MKQVLAALFILHASAAYAANTNANKRFCAPPIADNSAVSLEQFSQELLANNISVVPGNVVQPQNVDKFLKSYNKFPASLRSEMVTRGARIVIMEGEGVTTDLTFTHNETFDGRDWSKVPGSGGEVSEHFNIPTRIVVNSLNHNHGSADLVLHEHAHTLDSLYGRHGISNSGTWHNLIAADPSHLEFLKMLGGDYTSDHPEEAFAELFAYYFNCEATKKHMEETVPQIADFFKNLNSVKALLDASPVKPAVSVFAEPAPKSAEIVAPAVTNITPVNQKEDCPPTETKEIASKIQPLTNLTPYLQNYPRPGFKPNAFQISYPVYPTRSTSGR